jgi:hypothetical protein
VLPNAGLSGAVLEPSKRRLCHKKNMRCVSGSGRVKNMRGKQIVSERDIHIKQELKKIAATRLLKSFHPRRLSEREKGGGHEHEEHA